MAKKHHLFNRSFSIIVNGRSRPVLVDYKSNKVSFPLKGSETMDTFAEILTKEQKTDSGMTFSIDRFQVTILPPEGRIKEFVNVGNTRGYFTEIGIPVKGFVRHEYYL